MKRYTDLFIDFDDTLYDTHGNAVISLCELFDEFGFSRWFAEPEEFYTRYWEANIDLWTRYAKAEVTREYLIIERFRRPLSYGVDKEGNHFEPTVAFCLQVSDRFLELCSVKSAVVEGAHELMCYLQSRGYRMHLCSNGFHEVQYKKLHASDMMRYFDTVILSEDAGANKPSVQFFDYAMQQTHAKLESTIMIGDNLSTDILGAKSYGLDTIFFNRYPEYPALEEVTHEVHSLKEISKIL